MKAPDGTRKSRWMGWRLSKCRPSFACENRDDPNSPCPDDTIVLGYSPCSDRFHEQSSTRFSTNTLSDIASCLPPNLDSRPRRFFYPFDCLNLSAKIHRKLALEMVREAQEEQEAGAVADQETEEQSVEGAQDEAEGQEGRGESSGVEASNEEEPGQSDSPGEDAAGEPMEADPIESVPRRERKTYIVTPDNLEKVRGRCYGPAWSWL